MFELHSVALFFFFTFYYSIFLSFPLYYTLFCIHFLSESGKHLYSEQNVFTAAETSLCYRQKICSLLF